MLRANKQTDGLEHPTHAKEPCSKSQNFESRTCSQSSGQKHITRTDVQRNQTVSKLHRWSYIVAAIEAVHLVFIYFYLLCLQIHSAIIFCYHS